MNQGIPLSQGCTGNTLSNQRSIDDEETTQQDKALPDQSGKGKKLSQSGISMVFQKKFCQSVGLVSHLKKLFIEHTQQRE